MKHYYNGKLHGPISEWYDGGVKQVEGAYNENTPVGRFQQWYSNGKLMQECWFLAGQLHGPFVQWYENGNKMEEVAYVDGKKHGLLTTWYPNGVKQSESWLVKGVSHGQAKGFFDNGSVAYEESYVDGAREGTYSAWDESGNLSLQVDFKADYPVDFDHHKITKEGLKILLEITADPGTHTVVPPNEGPTLLFGKGEDDFFKKVGRPDSGYEPVKGTFDNTHAHLSFNNSQAWGFRCRDGLLQFPVWNNTSSVLVNPPPR